MGRRTPKVQYSNHGRSGHVIYTDEAGSIELYFEFGGGNCIAVIDIPPEKDWQKKTGRPLAQREPILTFIAQQCVRDQAPNGKYRITRNNIEILE